MDSSPGAALVHKKKDFKFQVPYNWQSNMAEGDMQWVGPEIFRVKSTTGPRKLEVRQDNLRLWYHPPASDLALKSMPQPETYFRRCLFCGCH